MSSESKFFDEIKKRIEFLQDNPSRDNEASRHDQLIYPILTSKYGLEWHPSDLVSQSTIHVPEHIKNSHLFRGAVPKIRKPDILICPPGFDRNIAVLEEKNKQANIEELNGHRLQVHEYQSLYQCTWGVLSDGERWIVKRNFETHHEFSSVDELVYGINDLRHCLGRAATTERLSRYGTSDILMFVTVPSLKQQSLMLPPTCEIFGFENNIPVTVCGVQDRIFTMNGDGYENFQNLESALRAFPDLHPRICTKRFTWAMKETSNNKIVRLRFETWAANDLYSR